MRFVRIEVENFRAIRRASVDFGPGLNVLFGPNDWGKTTLASAMRAALLLPADSSAHQTFLPWQSPEPPTISLSFEAQGNIWRIRKTFGSGSAASARLECSPDGSSFHEEERGRAVERRVRELLGWGIEAPGGKSGQRGLPESFLSHVLLGGQSDAPQILERSLGSDRDDSGRQRLHQALSALAQDPTFKRVLDAAQAKVDSAFTLQGRKKTGQHSPFASLREQINQLVADFERFAHQRRESEEVQARVALLANERLEAEENISAIEKRLGERRSALAEQEAQRAVRERHAALRQKLELHLGKQREIAVLEGEVTVARQLAEAEASALAGRLETMTAAEAEWARAEAALSEQSGDAAQTRRALQRAELERKHAELAAHLAVAEDLAELAREQEEAQEAARKEAAELARVEDGLRALSEKTRVLTAARERTHRLEVFCQGREAMGAAERALAARSEGANLERRASHARAREAAALASAREMSVLAPSVLSELRQLEAERRVAAARLDVGLSMRLRLHPGERVELAVDGGKPVDLDGGAAPHTVSAKSRVSMRLSDTLELDVAAGDPELHAEYERLEQRWRARAQPLLSSARAGSVEELAEQSEQGRALEREADEARRDASALAGQAEEKRAQGADLERWKERAQRHLQGFDESDRTELACAAAALGVSWERALAEQSARAEAEHTRVSAALEIEVARATTLRARAAGLAQMAGAARERLDRKLRETGGWGEASPSLTDLVRRVAQGKHAAEAVSAQLETLARSIDSEAARARRQRDEAAAALGAVRAERDAREAASLAARERHLELAAQLRERKLHFDGAALDAARVELEQSEGEVRRLPALAPVTTLSIEEDERELERARGQERQRTGELRRAEGALGQIGGDVAAERERQTQEALARARELEVELERDYEGYRLLAETLREVENDQGVHLGRVLERPVSERFDRLTRGRYGSVELDADLGLRGVVVAGEHRGYRELSEGTQEQLATILRLCIAEYLETALVLDDHLAQTHRQRAEWFRAVLRDAGERIQIIVLTARPEDLLGEDELAHLLPDAADARVRAIDLERLLERASYRHV